MLDKENIDNEKVKNRLNIALYNREFNFFETYVIYLDYEIQFATSYVVPFIYKDIDTNPNFIDEEKKYICYNFSRK